MKGKIATFLDYNMNVKGGAQFSSLLIIEMLKLKYDFLLVMPGIEKNKICKNILIDNIDYFPSLFRNPYKYLKAILKIKEKIEEEKIEIYHCQMPVSLTMVGLLKKFKLISNKPLIYTDRGLYEDYHWINKLFIKFLSNEIDIFITTTTKNYNDWKNKIEIKKMRMIHNTSFLNFEKEPLKIKKTTNKKLKIGFAGRFCEIKDWPLAEKIAGKLLEKSNVNVKFIIGAFTFEDFLEIEKMKKRILNKYKNSSFILETNLNFDDMKKFYDEIDIFISTSKNESFGRVVVEAMSQKCCIFGKKVGGLQEVIGNEDFFYSNIDELLNKLNKLNNNRENLNSYQNYFYDRYVNNFSLEANKIGYETIYEEILERKL